MAITPTRTVDVSTGDPRFHRTRTFARMIFGSLLEFTVKAYGAAAATAVAVGTAESIRDKILIAVNPWPLIRDKYGEGKYVYDHQDEILGALDYLKDNTPSEAELEAQIDRSTATLGSIETTYEQVRLAKADLLGWPNPVKAVEHVRAAWEAKPDLESIRELNATAKQFGPLTDQASVLARPYYENVHHAVDNLARDELWTTLSVMGATVLIFFALGTAIGFWVRRGRPGIIASVLQRLGARVFRRWYLQDPDRAMGGPLYDVAREHAINSVIDDPHSTLTAEQFEELRARIAAASTPPR